MFDFGLHFLLTVCVGLGFLHTDAERVVGPDNVREYDIVTIAVANHRVPTHYQEEMGEEVTMT